MNRDALVVGLALIVVGFGIGLAVAFAPRFFRSVD